jgi:general secretion pathway protein K
MMGVAVTRRQTGVALITVLLITAVITIIVATMATQQSVDIRRTMNVLDRNQAYLLTLGAEAWAKRVLEEDLKQGNLDYRLEDWAVSLPPIDVEGGTISGFIQDRNGCFNLNNLVENGVGRPDDINRFKRLLAALDLSPDLADAVVDWIDTDNQVSYPGGAESDYYARLETPYAIANRPLISSSELAAVKGMTPEALAKLRPQVCALPKRTRININTATPEVLMTLAPNMTPDIAAAIVEARDAPVGGVPSKGYFKSVSELYTVPRFNAILNNAVKARINDAYGVASDFFLVTANGTYAKADVILYSLLERGGSTITTYYRAQGSY